MSSYKSSDNLMVSLAAIVIILTGIKFAEAIISPLLIALFITAISGPAMLWLLNRKVPAGLAVTLIILTIVIIGFFISSILSTSFQSFSANMPVYQERLLEINTTLTSFLAKSGIHLQLTEFTRMFNLGKVMGFVGSTFNQVLGTLTNIFLILI